MSCIAIFRKCLRRAMGGILFVIKKLVLLVLLINEWVQEFLGGEAV